MSENVKKQIIEQEHYTHEFYCDKCNKFLGETDEHDNGWYQELGEYEQSLLIHSKDKNKNGWYTLKLCLCSKCSERLTDNILSCLQDFGFIKEF